ncbi:HAMP domain-containing protein, partial [Klebsiella pneumoniae]|uniref:HAMP domain-containing protein n=1 Tax=Klebsiella pneumoniae TaxID=573 RepID=UPI0025709334
TVSADVSQFVAGLDQLVSGFDRTTEMRIETVVLVHRVMAVFMALLLVFTIIWLRARLLQPWRQLLAMASAVSHRDFTQRANISGRNEMAMLGTALNNMSAELAESYAVLEQRVQEKTAGQLINWGMPTLATEMLNALDCQRTLSLYLQASL